MPRPLRQIVSGGVYHVLNRVNGWRRISRKPAHFQAFVDVLAEGLERYRVELLAWCVMSGQKRVRSLFIDSAWLPGILR